MITAKMRYTLAAGAAVLLAGCGSATTVVSPERPGDFIVSTTTYNHADGSTQIVGWNNSKAGTPQPCWLTGQCPR